MVNKRRRGPMHRQDAGAPSRQRQRARVPAERARRRAFFCARCRFARESRDPGATRRAASVTLLGPRKSGLPDLRAFECRSRASPRSVSRGFYPRAAQSADPGAARDTRAEHARGGAFLPTVPACRVPPIASVGRSRYIGGRLLQSPGRVSHARGTAEYRRRDQAVGRAAEEASLTSTRRARAWRTSTSRRRIPRSGTTSSARSG
jgi:hypothetical protein